MLMYMKKLVTTYFIIVLIATSSLYHESSKAFYCNENTLYVGGSGPGNYSKIQEAINNATEGDTVFVFNDSAPYYENLLINKSLNLIGEDKETTIIDGTVSGDVIKVTADYVFIKGFTITNGSRPGEGIQAGGIRLEPSSHSTITGNIIINNDKYGIRSAENTSSHNTISHNIISGNGREEYGAFFNIWLFKSPNNIIENNTIINGKRYGIGICYWSKNTTVTGNIIANNKREGIKSRFSYDNKIFRNTIENNGLFGIRILYGSANNSIYQNNFINNKPINVWFILTDPRYPNHWNENYWGKPRNIPKLLIGYVQPDASSVFGFIWFAIDWHPAKEPYNI